MRPPALLACALLSLAACGSSQTPTEPAPKPAPSEPEPAAEPSPTGYWLGAIELPGNQGLDWILSLQPTDDATSGAPVAKLWIPAQGVHGVELGPAEALDDPPGALKVEWAAVAASWTLVPGEAPTCSFAQRGVVLPCELEAVDAEAFAELTTPPRPQTPKPPFPYAVEEVRIKNPKATDVELAGTLTLPEGPGPHPGVVLISGSGLQDRDETLFGHKPFWVLADHLSRRGVAVLRYDDRGFAESTGDPSSATMIDFAGDAWAALDWLAEHERVDGERVGLLGHSEGGAIAPLVAAEHPKAVDFVVMLAGPGVSGTQIIVHQLGLLLAAAGVDEAEIAKQQAQARALHQAVLDHPDDPEKARAALEAVVREQLPDIPDAEVEKRVATLTQPWMRHFLSWDPAPVLTRVQAPVLALNGELDLQVDPEQNLPAIEAALSKAKNPAVDLVRLPGLNHLLQPAETGAVDEYGQIETTMDPAALERISAWIRATTGLD